MSIHIVKYLRPMAVITVILILLSLTIMAFINPVKAEESNKSISNSFNPSARYDTKILDITSFLEKCPNSDSHYSQWRNDFRILIDDTPVENIPCTEPVSSMPIADYSNALISMQVIRTIYYMDPGAPDYLPWTSESFYAWMTSRVAGVNLKTAPGQLYCCDTIGGRLYLSQSLQDDGTREWKRTWIGIASTIDYFAHETRHADGGPGHLTGCADFPNPGDPAGCDLEYNLSNLGSYGVQYWLNYAWLEGNLNIGMSCAPDGGNDYMQNLLNNVNNVYRDRFVQNIPPIVTIPDPPYGGICRTSTFNDVPHDYWAYDWIERLYNAGITSGCGTNPLIYCPESPVSRAQMAKFIEKGINGSTYTPPAGTGMVFADVSLSYWAVNWIEQLYADYITSGCNTNPLRYCPDDTVTRAQMAKFLLVAEHGAGYTPPAVGGSTGFGDVSTSHWAAAWIKQLAAEGITSGCGSGNYCPDDSVTRAQMAKFLVLTFNLP